MKNITLSAEERLIEAARERARTENTTLNDQFRLWLASYADTAGRLQRYDELMPSLRGQLKLGRFIIILGGGHETSYGHFLGYAIGRQHPSVLNWDAHADVRPLRDRLAHSGSPFRQAIEHPTRTLRSYTVAGLQPQAVAASHLEYVRRHGRALFCDEVTPTVMRELYAKLEAPGMVSFDMDAVDQAFAPGVSAPATGGFGIAPWLELAYEAGRNAAVRSCDLVEFNPMLDRDGQTGRLAALTVWHILRGFAARA